MDFDLFNIKDKKSGEPFISVVVKDEPRSLPYLEAVLHMDASKISMPLTIEEKTQLLAIVAERLDLLCRGYERQVVEPARQATEEARNAEERARNPVVPTLEDLEPGEIRF
jgi:hypothetical protein